MCMSERICQPFNVQIVEKSKTKKNQLVELYIMTGIILANVCLMSQQTLINLSDCSKRFESVENLIGIIMEGNNCISIWFSAASKLSPDHSLQDLLPFSASSFPVFKEEPYSSWSIAVLVTLHFMLVMSYLFLSSLHCSSGTLHHWLYFSFSSSRMFSFIKLHNRQINLTNLHTHIHALTNV